MNGTFAVYRLVLRAQLTVGRIAAFVAAGGLLVLIGIAFRNAPASPPGTPPLDTQALWSATLPLDEAGGGRFDG